MKLNKEKTTKSRKRKEQNAVVSVDVVSVRVRQMKERKNFCIRFELFRPSWDI